MASRKKAPAAKPNPDRQAPTALARALADRKPSADSEALLSDLIEVRGGTRQLAIDMHAEFQKAAKGGMTRRRILEMIQRLIIHNTNREVTKVSTPADRSDDELESVALAYLRRVNDAPTSPPAVP